MCSEADITALDALGRVHLVEVKQNQAVTDAVVEQAAHYAFRYVFVSPTSVARGHIPDAAHDFALYFAALYAGRQTKNLGVEDVERYWNRRDFWDRIKADFGDKRTKAAYRRLNGPQLAHVLGEVALELALERKRELAPRRHLGADRHIPHIRTAEVMPQPSHHEFAHARARSAGGAGRLRRDA